MTVKPAYWPRTILGAVRRLLEVEASAKKVTSTKASSMLVMRKVRLALPMVGPSCIATRGVASGWGG